MKKPDWNVKKFIAWLRKKPANKEYRYSDIGNCLLCQYLRSQGFRKLTADPWTIYTPTQVFAIPRHLNKVAVDDPMTFGGALERAKKIAA